MKFVILAAVLATAYGGIIAPVAYTVPFAAPIAVSSQYHAQDTLGQYNYGYINGLSSKAEVKSVDGITRGGYTYVDAEGKLQSVQYTSDSANGFRVAATNLPVAPPAPKVEPLPQPIPVQDTPEVAAEKAKHLAALEEAKVKAAEPVSVTTSVVSAAPIVPALQTYAYGISSPIVSTYGTYAYPSIPSLAYAAPWLSPSFVVNAPVAPADTPEVAKAKAEHLAAVEEVKARN
ncbi:cuticle protein 6-like [Zophobas morio]|uniref:cuticle protein 6-like n=1 Tax=Zophobas morio TaxID=2755281 RepID=UPI0030830041